MNERIAKLANQCGFDVDKTGRFGDYPVMYKLEKFAELIVKECVEVASPNYVSTPEVGVHYVEQAIDRIAEHFGDK